MQTKLFYSQGHNSWFDPNLKDLRQKAYKDERVPFKGRGKFKYQRMLF